MKIKPPLQKISYTQKESYTKKMKTNITMKGQEILNLKRRTDK
jgi:hypothetical protein